VPADVEVSEVLPLVDVVAVVLVVFVVLVVVALVSDVPSSPLQAARPKVRASAAREGRYFFMVYNSSSREGITAAGAYAPEGHGMHATPARGRSPSPQPRRRGETRGGRRGSRVRSARHEET